MTKKELLELIKDFPDEATVYLVSDDCSCGEAELVQLEKRIINDRTITVINIGA